MTLFSARRLARIDLRSSECFDCNDVLGHGLFQRGVALFAAASAFAVHCHTQAFELIASDVDHWCSQPAGVNMSSDAWKNAAIPLEPDGRFSRCRVYASPGDPNITETVPCLQWDYDPRTAHESLVSRWDLVCHRRPLVGLANAVYSAGALVAMLAAGYAADHVGRKLVIQLSVGILLAATMGIAFADTYVIYVTTRFINSAAVTSVFVISYILLYEVSSHDHRHVHTTVAMGMGLTLSDVWFDVLKQGAYRLASPAVHHVGADHALNERFFPGRGVAPMAHLKQGIKAAEVATLTLAKVNGFSLPTTAAMMVKIKDEMLKNQEALLQRAPCVGRDCRLRPAQRFRHEHLVLLGHIRLLHCSSSCQCTEATPGRAGVPWPFRVCATL
ncbi:hypothetical protein HPB49_018267 [Dermacentor silvarum]|uniref:Uncharacterized protein n=1 Tax=Dermacentor silvarum TaxID=543639 RepID=A0ACB8CZ74_DERSI|nr:hypothetical protein HPB49_018267 [Dermacentor silvarum]